MNHKAWANRLKKNEKIYICSKVIIVNIMVLDIGRTLYFMLDIIIELDLCSGHIQLGLNCCVLRELENKETEFEGQSAQMSTESWSFSVVKHSCTQVRYGPLHGFQQFLSNSLYILIVRRKWIMMSLCKCVVKLSDSQWCNRGCCF